MEFRTSQQLLTHFNCYLQNQTIHLRPGSHLGLVLISLPKPHVQPAPELAYSISFLFHSLPSSTLMGLAAAAAKSLQSCPTLCDPIDGSPPSSPVPGILQARTLEWVAISFSNAWKWNVKVKSLSRVRPSATPWTAAFQAPPSMGFSRQEYWSGVPLPSPLIPLVTLKPLSDECFALFPLLPLTSFLVKTTFFWVL